ncbi:MAG: flavodoxin domain-containing protein [Candidatus Omnitrophica bacterium]|nr:flavodoxin domain-containing protein [Candidatus Omnitrophota bacterium]
MALEIIPGIYSVGVVDWNVRSFHGHTYSTNRGSTYNSYLIVDEKIALVDTVLGSFAGELIENIRKIIAPEKIDYIIANHVETDHSGALPEIMKLCPKAKVVGTQKCKEGLFKHYYGNWDFQVVHSQDKISLGKRSLTFIEAPMIHWPDSMFTYCLEEQLLMPNDAFGQHYATSQRFDDETDQCALMDEAAKYYANILWPLGPVILKKIEEIQKLNIPIKIIAPSHGVIWRKDPERIINSYLYWAKNSVKEKAVIVYETMWGATEKMARKIAEGLIQSGIEVKLFDVATSDRTEMTKEMLDSKGFLFGSSTHDNDMLPMMAGFLEFVKGLRPKNRAIGVFGSYGWAGGAVKEIENLFKEIDINTALESLSVKYIPDQDELNKCFEYGINFANIVRNK